MIYLELTDDNFINDIHPLVKAFFPGKEVEVSYFGETPAKEAGIIAAGEVPAEEAGINVAGESPKEEAGADDGGVTPEKEYYIKVSGEHEVYADIRIPDIAESDRLKMKNVLKCVLYERLSDKLKVKLPWGTLSGIRPVRLAMNHLTDGFSRDETIRWMEDYYLVSPEKSILAAGIAGRELGIIEEVNDPEGYSLYIGIPFCPTTCLYCSFTSNAISAWKPRVGEYLSCVEKEMDLVKSLYGSKAPTTVYIGGGTPTTLEVLELKRLFDSLYSKLNLDGILEFTVEAGRPDSINREKLKVLKDYGVDRISVNPQTMNDKTLELIGRRHSTEDIRRAFKEAREAGFDNINMDIILGLPGEGADEVRHTMEEIKKLEPDDLTVHSLAVKRGSKLKEILDEAEKNGEKIGFGEDPSLLMDIAAQGAREMGLSPYYLYRQKNMSGNFENTGWAKPGKEGLYNILMMEEVQSIPALGAGTVSKCVLSRNDIRRGGNVKNVSQYMDRIDEMIERKRELFRPLK